MRYFGGSAETTFTEVLECVEKCRVFDVEYVAIQEAKYCFCYNDTEGIVIIKKHNPELHTNSY